MELKELTSAFAAKMGIDGLTVQDGACALEIDGIPLQIAETAAGGAHALGHHFRGRAGTDDWYGRANGQSGLQLSALLRIPDRGSPQDLAVIRF